MGNWLIARSNQCTQAEYQIGQGSQMGRPLGHVASGWVLLGMQSGFGLCFWAFRPLGCMSSHISSHEIKRHLLLGRKIMTNLDSILKSRDVTLPTKVHLVKAMVFPVVMYGCESWTIKKAEARSIDAFELWCWRRLLRVPWTARRSNQSILKETSHAYSLKGLMLRLKLQYLGHLMWRTDSLEKTLILGKIEGRWKRGWQDEMVGWHHRPSEYESE